MSPNEIATFLDSRGIAVRTGHHCAMPTMDRFGVAATARLSLGLYNTMDEIDRTAEALHELTRLYS